MTGRRLILKTVGADRERLAEDWTMLVDWAERLFEVLAPRWANAVAYGPEVDTPKPSPDQVLWRLVSTGTWPELLHPWVAFDEASYPCPDSLRPLVRACGHGWALRAVEHLDETPSPAVVTALEAAFGGTTKLGPPILGVLRQ